MIFSFLLKGKFAHFKHHFSFKTRTTYIAPLKTELIGILLNIMGIYREYIDIVNKYLDKINTGVYIIKIGSILFDSANLRKMPKSLSKIDRIRSFYKIEILNDVEYLVFYDINDENLSKNLEEIIESGYKGVPFLGISDFIADMIPLNIKVEKSKSDRVNNTYIEEDLIEDIILEENSLIKNQRIFYNQIKRYVFFYNAEAKLKKTIETFKFEYDGKTREVPVF